MTIIAATHSPINTSTARRPFGVGLVEPAPDVTGDWRSEVRACMRSLGYPPCNVAEALKALKAGGRVVAVEGVIDAEDVEAINATYEHHCPSAAQVAAEIAQDMPAHCGFDAYEPTAEERAWWFKVCDDADRMALNPNGIVKPKWRPWRGKNRQGRAR